MSSGSNRYVTPTNITICALRQDNFFIVDSCYDYAVPEMGTVPLLSPDQTLPLQRPHINSVGSDVSRSTGKSSKSDGKKVSQLENYVYIHLYEYKYTHNNI